MNNLKRLIAVMMVLTIALCFAACGEAPATNGPTNAPATTAPTTAPTTVPPTTNGPELDEPDYVVYVVDQDGNPVAGVMVQLCDEGACYAPVTTDDNGVAEFFMEKDIVGAMTKVMMAAGYEFSTEYTMFAEGENTVTLTVTKTEG